MKPLQEQYFEQLSKVAYMKAEGFGEEYMFPQEKKLTLLITELLEQGIDVISPETNEITQECKDMAKEIRKMLEEG